MTYRILTTEKFDKWFNSLKDKRVRFRVEARISMLAQGHFGDHKVIDGNISELRFFFGGGIRVYYTVRNGEVILLLSGGDKSSQSKDISVAQSLFEQLED